MRIKLATPLIGEFPRYADVKLPDNAATSISGYAASVQFGDNSVGLHNKQYAKARAWWGVLCATRLDAVLQRQPKRQGLSYMIMRH
jgi:hypothetical protein